MNHNKRFNESGYQRKLKDPRWLKRLAKLIQDASGRCSECSAPHSDQQPLVAHHHFYDRGRNPWDYPDYAFKVLCPQCSAKRQAAERVIKKAAVLVYASWSSHQIVDAFFRLIELSYTRNVSDSLRMQTMEDESFPYSPASADDDDQSAGGAK